MLGPPSVVTGTSTVPFDWTCEPQPVVNVDTLSSRAPGLPLWAFVPPLTEQSVPDRVGKISAEALGAKPSMIAANSAPSSPMLARFRQTPPPFRRTAGGQITWLLPDWRT